MILRREVETGRAPVSAQVVLLALLILAVSVSWNFQWVMSTRPRTDQDAIVKLFVEARLRSLEARTRSESDRGPVVHTVSSDL